MISIVAMMAAQSRFQELQANLDALIAKREQLLAAGADLLGEAGFIGAEASESAEDYEDAIEAARKAAAMAPCQRRRGEEGDAAAAQRVVEGLDPILVTRRGSAVPAEIT